MDNVTHTLAGLVVAHAALYLRGRKGLPTGALPAGPLPIAATSISALANNAPDLDFLYRGITPGRLGYLLHHRGHTHTLVAALPLGLFCVACVAGLLRLLGQRLSGAEVRFLFALATLGVVLHVSMDFGNNYGVHPFWPLDNHWYYGDAIFIVDPWLLILSAGIAFGASPRAASRAVLVLILVGLLLLAGTLSFGPNALITWPHALLLSMAALLWLSWMHWAAPGWRRVSGVAALGLFVCVQLLARQRARAHLQRALDQEPRFQLVSLVATPLPGNPLCWSMLAVGVTGGEYRVQQSSVAAWPAVWSASSCPAPNSDTTAPLATPSPPLPAAPGVIWGREFRAPLAVLHALVQKDCVARGFARFARVPFWIQHGEEVQLIGDLRYDRSSEIEFAELRLRPDASAERCPPREPPWRPPLPLLDPLVP